MKNKIKKIKSFIFGAISFLIFQANKISAQTIKIENPLSCDDLGCIVSKFISALTLLVIPILTIMVFVGGFQILFSGGNEEKIKTGKKTLQYAIIGYIIIILAAGIDSIIKSVLDIRG